MKYLLPVLLAPVFAVSAQSTEVPRVSVVYDRIILKKDGGADSTRFAVTLSLPQARGEELADSSAAFGREWVISLFSSAMPADSLCASGRPVMRRRAGPLGVIQSTQIGSAPPSKSSTTTSAGTRIQVMTTWRRARDGWYAEAMTSEGASESETLRQRYTMTYPDVPEVRAVPIVKCAAAGGKNVGR